MFRDLSEYVISAALAITAIAIVYSLFAQQLATMITSAFNHLPQ